MQSEINAALDAMTLRADESRADYGLNDSQAECAECLEDILGAFERVTRHSEGESYVTISQVPKWILELRDVTAPRPERLAKQQLRAALQHTVESRLASYLVVSRSHVHVCLLAAALDARYFELPFLAPFERDIVWDHLSAECQKFWDEDDQNLNPVARAGLLNIERVQAKMRNFAHTSSVEVLGDPLNFWRENGRHFAYWSATARMLLAVPSTTAPAERIFSSMGYSDRRARGRSNCLPSLAFVRANWKLVDSVPESFVSRMVEKWHSM